MLHLEHPKKTDKLFTRLCDVIFRAFSACAGSQGCMNVFHCNYKDLSYGETSSFFSASFNVEDKLTLFTQSAEVQELVPVSTAITSIRGKVY